MLLKTGGWRGGNFYMIEAQGRGWQILRVVPWQRFDAVVPKGSPLPWWELRRSKKARQEFKTKKDAMSALTDFGLNPAAKKAAKKKTTKKKTAKKKTAKKKTAKKNNPGKRVMMMDGYAYELDSPRRDWKTVSDEHWDLAMQSGGPATELGRRTIDDANVIVMKRGAKVYAQSVQSVRKLS